MCRRRTGAGRLGGLRKTLVYPLLPEEEDAERNRDEQYESAGIHRVLELNQGKRIKEPGRVRGRPKGGSGRDGAL